MSSAMFESGSSKEDIKEAFRIMMIVENGKRKRNEESENTKRRKSNGGSASQPAQSVVVHVKTLDLNEESSPFFLGLSDEVWLEILKYLTICEIPVVAKSCKAMYHYSKLSGLWKDMCRRICCDVDNTIQNYFPTANYNMAFKRFYGNCCVMCGKYLRGKKLMEFSISLAKSKGTLDLGEEYYNYYIDDCLCRKCFKESHCDIVTKTDAKKNYLVTDAELDCLRSERSSIPHRTSSAMWKFGTSTCHTQSKDGTQY